MEISPKQEALQVVLLVVLGLFFGVVGTYSFYGQKLATQTAESDTKYKTIKYAWQQTMQQYTTLETQYEEAQRTIADLETKQVVDRTTTTETDGTKVVTEHITNDTTTHTDTTKNTTSNTTSTTNTNTTNTGSGTEKDKEVERIVTVVKSKDWLAHVDLSLNPFNIGVGQLGPTFVNIGVARRVVTLLGADVYAGLNYHGLNNQVGVGLTVGF
jgi:hypothetical protein